jgi:hypothetical protein
MCAQTWRPTWYRVMIHASCIACIATWQRRAVFKSRQELYLPTPACGKHPYRDGQDSDRNEIGGRLQHRCDHIFKTGSPTALRTRLVLVD